jgi:hypothetical protein
MYERSSLAAAARLPTFHHPSENLPINHQLKLTTIAMGIWQYVSLPYRYYLHRD